MITSGFFISFVIIIQQIKKKQNLVQCDPTKLETVNQYEIYFFRIYQLIMSKDVSDHYILHGILCNHMNQCLNSKCPCISIMEVQDNVKISGGRSQFQATFHDDIPSIQTRINPQTPYRRRNKNDFSSHNMGGPYSKVLSNIGTTTKITMDTIAQTRTRRNMKYLVSGNDSKREQELPENWTLSERKKKKQETQWFRFLSLLIQIAIEKFPKDIDLRVVNSFVQNKKIKNEFKSIFELMNCESCNPSFQDQFILFRRKIQIEQILKKNHQRNLQSLGTIDVVQVYKYELYFQQYEILEYQTALIALSFWKELLSKNINTAFLQETGAQISKNYVKIQSLFKKLQNIYPTEIKLLFKYGLFLQKIVNNGYEALNLFEKVYYTYHGKISKKATAFNEVSLFGENSGSAIVIISATSKTIGTIIHANDEIEGVLGFKRVDILNKNISCLIPKPIGKVHDKFIERYFETAKPTVIDIRRQLFAVSNQGYLKPIRLLVKVYPQLNDKLVFLGFVQNLEKYDDMESPKQDYEDLEHQYIMTDKTGNITNVTEGLNFELGLNSKFLNYSDDICQHLFNIENLCPEILQIDVEETLEEEEGMVLVFDTRNLLNHIELERLSSEEILDIRTKLGRYEVYVQLKNLIYDQNFCTVKVYRVCILNQINEISSNLFFNKSQRKDEDQHSDYDMLMDTVNGTNTEHDGFIQNPSMFSSLSSTGSGSQSFSKIIKDFKKAIGQRKTPRHLVFLNRLIFGFLLSLAVIVSVDYALKMEDLQVNNKTNYQYLMIQSRVIDYLQLVSDVRSYINVANDLEFSRYDQGDESLMNISRFQFLKDSITKNSGKLQKTHEFISQIKLDESDMLDREAGKLIDLFRISENATISSYQLQYKIAFNLYLNYIQEIVNTNSIQGLIVPKYLLNALPSIPQNYKANQPLVNDEMKVIYFLAMNGLRDLRRLNQEMVGNYVKYAEEVFEHDTFLVLMIIGIVLNAIQSAFILSQIRINDRNKGLILALYSRLQLKEIKDVYEKCDQYLDDLKEGLFHRGKEDDSSIYEQTGSLNFPSTQKLQIPPTKQLNGSKNNILVDYQVSEEEKEAEIYRQYVIMKRIRKHQQSQRNRGTIRFRGNTLLEEKYNMIMLRNMQQIKAIQIQEEQYVERQNQRRQSSFIEQISEPLKSNEQIRLKSLKSLNKEEDHQIKNKDSDSNFTENEIEERTKTFHTQIKKVDWFQHIKLFLIWVVVLIYFGYIYWFHLHVDDVMKVINDTIPITYNIYSSLILSYGFFRERMVNILLQPNMIDEFDEAFEYDDIDQFYHEQILHDQSMVNNLKVKYSSPLQKIVDFQNGIDSENLCNMMIDKQRDVSDYDEFNDKYKQILNDNCDSYAQGLLSKGLNQAIGTFHKKFTDLKIQIQEDRNLTILQKSVTQIVKNGSSIENNSFKTYLQIQELYFPAITQSLHDVWLETFADQRQHFTVIIEAVFFIFLAFLLFLLLFSRKSLIDGMKNEVFQSRGILNLIPEEFFEENKDSVQTLIKRLKD